MLASAFTFYRGAAGIMAADLAAGPDSGLRVQLCGDAHLSNFGVFQAPDRRLVFDINDFDETLPGPFEWDVKRLAASVAIGARDRGFSPGEGEAAVLASVTAYRGAMHEFAAMNEIDVWYARLDVEQMAEPVAADGDQGRPPPAREEPGEGAQQGQPAGARKADRNGRRPRPDRRSAAAPGADRQPDRA